MAEIEILVFAIIGSEQLESISEFQMKLSLFTCGLLSSLLSMLVIVPAALHQVYIDPDNLQGISS